VGPASWATRNGGFIFFWGLSVVHVNVIYIYTYNIHILNIAYNLVYSHISFVTIPMNISHSPCISQCYEPPGATWLVTFEHYPRWMTRPLHSHPPRPGSRISMWDILHTCVQIYFYVVGIYIYINMYKYMCDSFIFWDYIYIHRNKYVNPMTDSNGAAICLVLHGSHQYTPVKSC
jgi:hypothetical protein